MYIREPNLGADLDQPDTADYRPTLADPTSLINGDRHPRYLEWQRLPWADTNPWACTTMELLVACLPATDIGYLDRDAVAGALGSRWCDVILGRHLSAKPAVWQRLADLIHVPLAELHGHVDRARETRHRYESMVQFCKWYPYARQTWERFDAGEPCPGCGRHWRDPDTPETLRAFTAEHAECQAGSSSLSGGGPHCNRCCGIAPPMSPERRDRFDRMIAQAAGQRAAAERAARQLNRANDVTGRVAARDAEIAAMERKLERLRARQAEDRGRLSEVDR